MSRSQKKGPYLDANLIEKIEKLNSENRKAMVKTWARASDISPEMVGHTLAIHNGKIFVEVLVNESMVGHKLGEFSPTRKFSAHSKKGYEGPKPETK